MLDIRLFGRVSIVAGQNEVRGLGNTHAGYLLAFLLLNPQRLHSRDTITDALWEDCGSQSPQKGLRQSLYELRRRLDDAGIAPETVIQADGELLGLAEDAPVSVDLWRFNDALGHPDAFTHLEGKDESSLVNAVALYSGELLPGCYFDWCQTARETARTRYLIALETLMTAAFSSEVWDDVINIGCRILAEDPILEYVHRTLMRAHYHKGCRASALRQYEICRQALVDLFDEPTEPMLETRDLYDAIRNEVQEPFAAGPEPARMRSSPPQSASPVSPRASKRPGGRSVSQHLREIADRLERLNIPL